MGFDWAALVSTLLEPYPNILSKTTLKSPIQH